MTPNEVYGKALEANKRLPELEHIIITDRHYAYHYAKDIIKGRWIEAEDVIMNDPYYSSFYAKKVIKGKLPEKMHNMMLLHCIEDPDSWAKLYFEFIK